MVDAQFMSKCIGDQNFELIVRFAVRESSRDDGHLLDGPNFPTEFSVLMFPFNDLMVGVKSECEIEPLLFFFRLLPLFYFP